MATWEAPWGHFGVNEGARVDFRRNLMHLRSPLGALDGAILDAFWV